MALVTSQQISKWYELYKTIDVTLTKEIIRATYLDPRNVFLKCLGEQWPCVLYSTSFSGAKVVASSKKALQERIQKANNLVSVRYSFRIEGKTEPLSFFVSGRVMGVSPYTAGGGDLQFMSIQYTQRPPDDLIEIMGRLLDANINSARRREERILLTPDTMRRIGLASKDTVVFVQGVPRKCIIRDLSFSGAKAIIVGLAKFLVGKECLLRLDLDDPRETLEVKGSIVRYEDVEGRKDLAAVAIHFDEGSVPMSYKMHINEYLSQVRQGRGEEDQAASAQAPKGEGEGAAAGGGQGGQGR